MTKEQILKKLKDMNSEISRKYSARVAGIFGSYVRDAAHPESDLDVLVDFNENANLLDFVGIAQLLEEQLALTVDVVPIDSIRPEIRDQILTETIYL